MALADSQLLFSRARPDEPFIEVERYGAVHLVNTPTEFVIHPSESLEVQTNLKIHFPSDYVAIAYLSERLKQNRILLLGPDVILSGLHELRFRLFNSSESAPLVVEACTPVVHLIFLRAQRLTPIHIHSWAYSSDEVDN